MRKKIRLLAVVCLVATISLAIALLLPFDGRIPSFAETLSGYRPSEAWLLDRHGEVVAVKRIDLRVRRLEWLRLDDISPAAQELLIQSEDRRYYQHGGVDWLALSVSGASGLLHLFDGKRPRGASTLTMQLAGFLDPSLSAAKSRRTLAQKWRQITAAREIEKSWSKREILEAYFNLASFRGETVGIHAAALALFGVHPSALNRSQSLLLMALLKGPSAKPAQVANRACALLTAARAGDPACAELQSLSRVALDRHGYRLPQDSIAPHLADKLLDQAGMRLATTLDANLQRYAIQSLREHLLSLNGQNVRDGAAVVIDNRSGDVLAYVGSSGEISDAAAVDGVSALRQAGSTLKPFLYGMAIAERRITAASILDDAPIQLVTPMGLYVPQNYDRDFKGAISARTALASSLNVPAVRTLALVGVDRFTRTLRDYGLNSVTEDGDHYGFSLALGGVDVRLIELANAYRALANRGVWNPAGYLPGDHATKGKRILSRQAAFVVADILSDRGARALTFGLENPLATRAWTAVKTGTSKDMRDNWCIGFSSRYTVGVWVGNFDGEPMNDVSGVSGAAPVWRDLMDYLHADGGGAAPAKPQGIVTQEVQFSPSVESPRIEHFLAGTETAEIRLVADGGARLSGNAKILYPTDGTVIAIDPDIPIKHQRVQFSSRGPENVVWRIDGNAVGNGGEIGWQPTGGRHRLTLAEADGEELDAVTFEVRGSLSP
jgi:penicillin-binding protein 1C